jgi:hypothetical protein
VTANGATSPAVKLTLDPDGSVTAPTVYSTIAAGRTMTMTSAGLFGYTSSSARYKTNIKNMKDSSWLYKLRPVEFDRKDGSSYNEMGLIAEEVAKVEPRVITLNEKGQPESVEYIRLIPALIAESQKHQEQLDLQQDNLDTQSEIIAHQQEMIDTQQEMIVALTQAVYLQQGQINQLADEVDR